MHLKNFTISKLNFIVALSALFLFASCGSYQYVGYENDGIYDSDEVVYEESENVSTDANSSSYYKNYFKEKSDIIEGSDSEIFTDIDSYQGTALEEQDSYLETPPTGLVGWGENSSEISINFYNNNPYWGGFGPYGWGGIGNPYWGNFGNPYFGGYWGRGFIGRGVGIGFGFSPFWGAGRFGRPWGYGYAYNPYYLNYGFDYGFRTGHPYYGNPYYGNRGHGNYYAYNRGRRSSAAQLGRRTLSNSNSRENTLSRSNRTRVSSDGTTLSRRPRTEINRNGVGVTPNRPTNRVERSTRTNRSNTRAVTPNRSTRPRVNSTPRRSNPSTRSSTPRSRPTTTRSNSSRSNRSFNRSSSSGRSSSGRSSSSVGRSSSSRSSGSVSRSSGRRNN